MNANPSPLTAPPHPSNHSEILPDRSLYELIKGRHGLFLVNKNDRYIGKSLLAYGEFSELEWNLLEQIAPKGGVVAEIGSHLGSLTIPLAKQVGKTGKILAFEPQPILFQNLCANLSLNGLLNCNAFNAGCGKEKRTINIPDIKYDNVQNYGGIQLKMFDTFDVGQPVEIIPFDNFGLTRLNLMKLDVEGMELEVLQGAQKTIERCYPAIYAENHMEDSGKEVIRFLLDIGYNVWTHIIPLFNDKNYFQNPENIFSNFSSFNIICLPKKLKVKIELPQIKTIEDWDAIHANRLDKQKS
ncbi:MAG: FkbM family methyltransferase [Pseudomonadota bacterium]